MKIQSINQVNNNRSQNPNFGSFIVPNELVGRFENILPKLEGGDSYYFTHKDLAEQGFHSGTGKILEAVSEFVPNHTLFLNFKEKMEAGNFVLMGGEGMGLIMKHTLNLIDNARRCTEETLTKLEAKMKNLTKSGASPDKKLDAMRDYELKGTL